MSNCGHDLTAQVLPRCRQGWRDQAELLTEGPLFVETAQQLAKSPQTMPPLHASVKIKVEAVFDQSVGPDAGKQIA